MTGEGGRWALNAQPALDIFREQARPSLGKTRRSFKEDVSGISPYGAQGHPSASGVIEEVNATTSLFQIGTGFFPLLL